MQKLESKRCSVLIAKLIYLTLKKKKNTIFTC